MRSDVKRPAGIDAGDRPAARRDAGNVEAAKRDALSGQHAVGRKRCLPTRYQRDVGAGAAHVERHEIGNTEQFGAAAAAGDTAGRSRQYRARSKPRGFLKRSHAAVRQDYEEIALESGFGQARFEIVQIAPHHRLDIGIHDRGRDALIFLDLRQHVARARDADIGQRLGQTLHRREFVHGVEVGMQKTNRDRARAGLLDGRDALVQRLGVERGEDIAVGLEPFQNSETAFARHQRLRWRRPQIIAVRLEALAHLDQVAVALGGQQRDLGALSLQQRIGRDRRSVNQARRCREQFAAGQVQSFGKLFEACHHADRLVGRGRWRLGEYGMSGLVAGDQVGEGAADVNPDRKHHELRRSGATPTSPCSRSRRRAWSDRRAGGPQPPPPEERISRQSPGRISTPTSLVRNTRGSRPSDNKR